MLCSNKIQKYKEQQKEVPFLTHQIQFIKITNTIYKDNKTCPAFPTQ